MNAALVFESMEAYMKICLIHNEYSKISGEEIVVNLIIELLRENGHDVYFRRSSNETKRSNF